ncbi:MAG TPA: sensor domain-containing protein [Streptosporangiaceae bacterium]|nr:sensor domain-containing protein [Streptosporangiaceae bacterium]
MRQPHTSVSLSSGRRSPDDRLRLRANPLRLALSATPWLAAGYLLTYLLVSWVLFSVVVTASVLTAILAVTIALVPLLIATAAVIRACAAFERFMLGLVFREPVRGDYPMPAAPGLWRRARSTWKSGATWRDIAYLAGLWVPLFLLDAVVFAVWAVFLAGITLPLWYRHVADVCIGYCGSEHTPGLLIGNYPHGPHGAGASGLWIYNSLGPALLVAAACLAAFLLFNYVVIATAQLHAQLARTVLRGGSDPLEPARAVLAEPGPLGPLI